MPEGPNSGVDRIVAVDVALLPPPAFRERLVAINSTLAPPPAGFRFDETHLPHLTLVQQFVERNALEPLSHELGRVLQDEPPVGLTTTQLSVGGTAATLGVVRTSRLLTLHRRLMDLLLPFDALDGDVEAFETDVHGVRESDLAWVRNFREGAAYDHFSPHWTLGVGTVDDGQLVGRPRFEAGHVALCRLGRFCTCRRVLASWTLTARDR